MHPKVKELFDDHPEIQYIPTALDDAEKNFLVRTKNFEKTETIDQLWRTRKGGIKATEYLWYLKKTVGKDHKGNKIAFVKPEAKWDMPILSFEYSDQDGEGKASGIQTYEEMYDIPFSKEKLQEFLDKDMITGTTGFCIDAGTRKYAGFTYDMFMERDFDDLVYFGQNGKFPTAEEKAILTGPPSKRMGLVKNVS